MDIESTIIIDQGSTWIRAGFAGENKPRCILPNDAHSIRVPSQSGQVGNVVEADTKEHSDDDSKAWKIGENYPTAASLAEAWLAILRHHLKIEDLTNYTVLYTGLETSNLEFCEIVVSIFIQHLGVKAISILHPSALALWSTGRTLGLVLECGTNFSLATPVRIPVNIPIYDPVENVVEDHLDDALLFEYSKISKNVQRVDVGGQQISEALSSAIEEQLLSADGTRLTPEEIEELKMNVCYVEAQFEQTKAGPKTWMLHDGRKVHVPTKPRRLPNAFFNPRLIGIDQPGVHQAIMSAIQSSPVEIQHKLTRNILVAGSSTLFPGFIQRLREELGPRTDLQARVYAAPDPTLAVWKGGVSMAAQDWFAEKFLICRDEWLKHGSLLVKRKCGWN